MTLTTTINLKELTWNHDESVMSATAGARRVIVFAGATRGYSFPRIVVITPGEVIDSNYTTDWIALDELFGRDNWSRFLHDVHHDS